MARRDYAWRGIEAINRRLLNTTAPRTLLSAFGAEIAAGGNIHGPLTIHNADPDYRHLHIGASTHIGRGVFLDLTDVLTIGDEATVSMGCTILTHQDIGHRPLAVLYPRTTMPTAIGRGSYLGANVTVLCGCDIGAYTVVGAGAVVTDKLPDFVIAVGVPARVIGEVPRAAVDTNLHDDTSSSLILRGSRKRP